MISLSLMVYLLYGLFGSVDYSLHPGSQFIIGQATLDGVDVGKRVAVFYRAMSILLIGAPVMYLLVDRLLFLCGIQLVQRNILVVLSVTALLMLIAHVCGLHGLHAVHFMYCLSGLTLLFLMLGEKIRTLRFLKQPLFLTLLFSATLILMGMGMAFWNESALWNTHFNPIFCMMALCCLLMILITRFVVKISLPELFASIRHLLWIPLCIWLGVELSFRGSMHDHNTWTFKGAFLLLIGLWLFAVYIIQKYKPRRMKATDVLKFYLAPGAIASIILFTQYHPGMALPGDLFELANPLNAQMNLWQFHRIPLLDFMSSHMLSEQWYGWLYHTLFGYHANADFLIYQSLEAFLFYGIMYYFLVRIFHSPIYALLFICCFPASHRLFTENLYPVMALLICLHYVLCRPSVKNYFVLFMLLFLAMLWRLDLGVSSLMMTLCAFPLLAFALHRKLEGRQLMKAALLFSGTISLMTGIGSLLRSPAYVLTQMRNALHYLGANQAHGYSNIAWEWNQHTTFFYVLLPLSACCFIFYLFYLLRYRSEITTGQKLILQSSFCLFLFMLFNFQRGLVRHGFIEANDTFISSTYYIAVSLFVLYLVRNLLPSLRYLVFVAVSLFQILVFTYFPLAGNASVLEQLVTTSTLKELSKQLQNHNGHRVDTKEVDQSFGELDSFFNRLLKPGQTFLDFSNSPALYYFTKRPVPSYFCQSLQNTVDQYTQQQQLLLLDTTRIPIVVYANDPPDWYDATDEVPNALRHPYLAEYIYRHYKPYAVVGKKQIWIAKHVRSGDESFPEITELHDYKMAADLQSDYYTLSGYKRLVFLQEAGLMQMTQDSCMLECVASTRIKNHVLLELSFDDPRDEVLELWIENAVGARAILRFATRSTKQTYMLRLSNTYVWHQSVNKTILLKGKGSHTLKQARWFEELTDN